MSEIWISFDEAIEFLEKIEGIVDAADTKKYFGTISILRYEREKQKEIKPNLVKTRKSYNDYYECGNCMFRVDVLYNYCPNCGREIKWDSARCLTGR